MLDAYSGHEDYFPVYNKTYIPGRKLFWEVFGSLYYDDAVRFINEQREDRYNLEEEEMNKKIKIDPIIYQEIMSCKYFSRKRGRALNSVTYKDQNGGIPISMNQNNIADDNVDNEKSPFKSISQKKRAKKLSAEKIIDMQTDRRYDNGVKKFQTPGNKDSNLIRYNNAVMMSADK